MSNGKTSSAPISAEVEKVLKKHHPKFSKLDAQKTFQTVFPMPAATKTEHFMVCEKDLVAEAVYLEFPNDVRRVQVSFPLTRMMSQKEVDQHSEKFLRLNATPEGGAIFLTPNRRLVATFQQTLTGSKAADIPQYVDDFLAKGRALSEAGRRVIKQSMQIDTEVSADPVFNATLGRPSKLSTEELEALNAGMKIYGGKEDVAYKSGSGSGKEAGTKEMDKGKEKEKDTDKAKEYDKGKEKEKEKEKESEKITESASVFLPSDEVLKTLLR